MKTKQQKALNKYRKKAHWARIKYKVLCNQIMVSGSLASLSALKAKLSAVKTELPNPVKIL